MLAAPMVQEILALLRSERLQIAAKQNRSELIDWPENFYSATPVNAVDMVIGHRGVIRFVISHGQPEHQQHWPEKPASVAASFPDAPRSIGRQKTVDLRVVVRLLRLTGERLSEFGRRRHFPLRFLSRHKWRPLLYLSSLTSNLLQPELFLYKHWLHFHRRIHYSDYTIN